MLSMTTIAADSFGPKRATLSLTRASSLACSRASMESLMTLACMVGGDRFFGGMSGERGKG